MPRCKLAIFLFCLLFSDDVTGQDKWSHYRSVCQIDVQNGNRDWQGSGTLVAASGGKGLILSCRHVNIRKGLQVKVKWYGVRGETTDGVVHYSMPGRSFSTDLAVVIADVPEGVRPVSVARFDSRNAPFYSVGYRRNRFLQSVASKGKDIGDNLLELNSPFLGGMSGGSTFDRYGRVVGVVVASDRYTTGICCDGDAMHRMLNAYRKR